MPYIERLKGLLDDPKVSKMPPPYQRKTNNESGPAGPLRIDEARDWEISWQNGRAILLNTPRVPTPEGEDMPETPKFRPDLTWDRGGAITGTLPSDPNAPLDKLNYVNKDRKIVEGNLSMSYVDRLAMFLALAAPSLDFRDVLRIVKNIFPDLKMQFPKPPTYVWNPKKKAGDEKEGDEGEEGDDTDETAKLEPQKIKDKLKVKLPQLKWTLRMSDGVEEAELGFTDESSALFEIGAKANHLTITYTEAPKGTKVVYDDSEPDDSKS